MHGNFPALADLKAGSNAAWTIAFSHLWPVAVRVARESTAQLTLSDAEEAASDAIRCTIDQIERVQSENDLHALVAVIARRRAISILREKFAAKRAPGGALVESSELQEYESLPEQDGIGDPCRDLIEAETVALLHKVLCELDPESRRLLLEKYVEGYSYDELSQKHNIPIGTLCPKLMRALRKLRRTSEQSPRLMKELKEFRR